MIVESIVVLVLVILSVQIIFEYEQAVVFQLGRYSRTLRPGLNFIIPIVERVEKVDLRLRVVDVPSQETITKDNISVRVDAVLYFRVVSPSSAVIEVRDFFSATSQLAQTTMRNIVGEFTLDQLLSERDGVSEKIRLIVDAATDPWGIKVEGVELKHIELPDDMKRVMAKAAEAERVKRATIIRSQGEAEAASVVSKAARLLNGQDGALNLRTLQSLNDLSPDPSNKVTFFVPLDLIKNYAGRKRVKW